ncbi:DUF294 nucleotidyltransferase-like domain-containing protein [Aureibacter tunicatorum]|uniref:Ribosomal protein L31 n=1 Tax=Aureibacter tunicatorum TaxID=866807 RepID=A0AAE3XQK7_9BACT|nr:DUF294 nucleotidyltransferase-like domain-containing protein [Aureibacter tunicatorum]MDR6240933.1 ribosomal protein L31 [Aureibacter tunicatorum]BDD03713.1 hypothetical protein AUTU_11960 [Aureibacter tunicatorum]
MRLNKEKHEEKGVSQYRKGISQEPMQCFKLKKGQKEEDSLEFFSMKKFMGEEDVDGQLYDALNVQDMQGFIRKLEELASWSPEEMHLSTLRELEKVGSADDDEDIEQALSVLKEKQQEVLEKKLGAEEGSRVFKVFRERNFQEMYDLLGQLDNDSLVKIAKDAQVTAEQMKSTAKSMTAQGMHPLDRMKFVTHASDYFLEKSTEESLQILGESKSPKHPFAIMGTGGFGRKEMQPASDIDFGVLGHDSEMDLIRLITDLIFFKLNLARSVFSTFSSPRCGANVGFESDPLWLQSTYSVGPAKVMENSAIKGTSEDARVVKVYEGTQEKDSDAFEKQIEEGRDNSREMVCPWAELKDVLTTYNPVVDTREAKFNIKSPLLRFLTMSLQKLSLVYHLPPMSSKERVDWLMANGKINPKMAEMLMFCMETLCGLRQKCHDFYNGEKDDVLLHEQEGNHELYTLSQGQYSDLLMSAEFLKVFHGELLSFVQRKDPKVLMEMPKKSSFFKRFLK